MNIFQKKKRDYIHDAFEVYRNAISRATENQYEVAVWWSWLAGAIELCEELKKIPEWRLTPDNLDSAKLLLEVYIQPMITCWFRSWESQESHSDEEKAEARSIAFRNVQTFLGISSEDSIKLYLGFDREFQALLNHERATPSYYMGMFHQRCCECVTSDQIVDWGKLQFPIESYGQFLEACQKDKYHHSGDSPEQLLRAYTAIVPASRFMLTQFEEVSKKD